jgi:hypothetical protein
MTKHRSKQVWITMRINIFLGEEQNSEAKSQKRKRFPQFLGVLKIGRHFDL